MYGYSGDGGPATKAQLNGPWSLALDTLGNTYIGDTFNQVIRKVGTGGPTVAVATPAFSPDPGVYATPQSVTITDTNSAAAIYYTTGGSTPTASSTVYSGPISVSATETIEAVAIAAGFFQSPVATANYTITPAKLAQTITFNAIPSLTYGQAPLSPAANASSGLPVSYTVSGPATVNGSTLAIIGTGTVTVTASQGGNATYSAATPVSQSFVVNKAELVVTANSVSRVVGAINPSFTYTISGFQYGETSSVVSGSANEVTTAMQVRPPARIRSPLRART